MNASDFKLYTYKYVWQLEENDKLCIKYVTDVMKGHEDFAELLRKDTSVKRAMREYINEFDVRYVSITTNIKGGENNEENIEKRE